VSKYLILLTSFAVVACSGTYRVVKKTQSGGEVALVGPQESAREKADEYMQSQCPTGFDIVEEGEAVVGSTTTARTTDGGKNLFGQKTATTSAESTDKREWRIKYQCKNTPPAEARVHELIIVF
jgi:hypothetical protein